MSGSGYIKTQKEILDLIDRAEMWKGTERVEFWEVLRYIVIRLGEIEGLIERLTAVDKDSIESEAYWKKPPEK